MVESHPSSSLQHQAADHHHAASAASTHSAASGSGGGASSSSAGGTNATLAEHAFGLQHTSSVLPNLLKEALQWLLESRPANPILFLGLFFKFATTMKSNNGGGICEAYRCFLSCAAVVSAGEMNSVARKQQEFAYEAYTRMREPVTNEVERSDARVFLNLLLYHVPPALKEKVFSGYLNPNGAGGSCGPQLPVEATLPFPVFSRAIHATLAMLTFWKEARGYFFSLNTEDADGGASRMSLTAPTSSEEKRSVDDILEAATGVPSDGSCSGEEIEEPTKQTSGTGSGVAMMMDPTSAAAASSDTTEHRDHHATSGSATSAPVNVNPQHPLHDLRAYILHAVNEVYSKEKHVYDEAVKRREQSNYVGSVLILRTASVKEPLPPKPVRGLVTVDQWALLLWEACTACATASAAAESGGSGGSCAAAVK